jgi:hypothetical protein
MRGAIGAYSRALPIETGRAKPRPAAFTAARRESPEGTEAREGAVNRPH